MKQPSARLIISIEGVDKSYILWNGTESYYKKLRIAFQDIKNDKDSEYLFFSFFTLCAATLEYSLNFTLTDFCLNHFGHDDYRKYSEGYINLPLPKKLLMSPTIVSKGKYRFNDDNSHFKTLNELITLRNRILHNKEFLKEFDFPSLNDQKGNKTIEFEIPIEPNHIDSLTKESCLKFGDALGKFKQCFMTPSLTNSLERNEMLIEL
jgi:hypothetical protein